METPNGVNLNKDYIHDKEEMSTRGIKGKAIELYIRMRPIREEEGAKVGYPRDLLRAFYGQRGYRETQRDDRAHSPGDCRFGSCGTSVAYPL